MKRKLLKIGTTLFSGTILVVILYLISGTPNTYKNGFKRNIKDKYLTPFHFMDLKIPNWQIVGATKSNIYLWNRTGPDSICVINYDLTKIRTEPWRIKILYDPSYLAIRIDSPGFEIHDRRHFIIYRYKLEYGKLFKQSEDSIPNIPFDLVMRISSHSYMSRTFNYHISRRTLTRFIYPGFLSLEDTTSIEKQIDGLFCTDGIMCYDSCLNKLIYIYYYRNQYLVLDSNLRLQKKYNTIDTVSMAPIKTHLFRDLKLTTFESPTVPTNKRAICQKGRLFVESGLLADNEDRRVFSNSSIIDEYDITKGRYLFSFYLPHFRNLSNNDFLVSDKLVIAIQGNSIVSYEINGD